MRWSLRLFFLPAALGIVLTVTTVALGASTTTERVSLDAAGGDANGSSIFGVDLSSDGRFIAFASEASDLVVGDGNGARDIFVRDRVTGLTERVSVNMFGSDHDGNAFGTADAAISADGRYVAFTSNAQNIVAGTQCVPNASGGCIPFPDVYVRDRATGTTEEISIFRPNGSNASSPSISADGRYVAFTSNAHRTSFPYCCGHDVHLRDRTLGTTQLISTSTIGGLPNGDSSRPRISADGRHVAFWSLASNLVPNDSNGTGGNFGGPGADIFVRDLDTGTTERVNVNMSGGDSASVDPQEPAISADGRYVAFYSAANDLVPGDTNGKEDAFVRDRLTDTTERISVSTQGAEGAFQSYHEDISADGRYVAFSSSSFAPLVGVAHLFLRDRLVGTTDQLDLSVTCGQPNGSSAQLLLTPDAALSPDARYVAFGSGASNLVPNDLNGKVDIFLAGIPTCIEDGHLQLVKTINGAAPTTGQAFSFELRQGSSSTQVGTLLESQVVGPVNAGIANFGQSLTPGMTYALCEVVLPGWATTLGPPLYVVYNPSGDNSTVCTDFTATSSETKVFAIDNRPPPGGLARTIGFWKNWASCAGSKGNQKPVLDQTLAAADPAGVAVGILSLHAGACLNAVRLLDKSSIDTGKKMAGDPAFSLAAQLVASNLNVVAGAGGCPTAISAINAAKALLSAVSFNGITHDKLTASHSTQAIALATTLDRYNNNLLC